MSADDHADTPATAPGVLAQAGIDADDLVLLGDRPKVVAFRGDYAVLFDVAARLGDPGLGLDAEEARIAVERDRLRPAKVVPRSGHTPIARMECVACGYVGDRTAPAGGTCPTCGERGGIQRFEQATNAPPLDDAE